MRAAPCIRIFPSRLLLFSLAVLLAAAPSSAATRYSLHALPELQNDVSSDAFGAYAHGGGGGGGVIVVVAGRSTSSGGVHHAVVWNASPDLGQWVPTSLDPVTPGAECEARLVRCADGTCRAVGTEGAAGAGQAPVLWTDDGSGAGYTAVSLTCPAQMQPASSDVGRTRGLALTIQGSNFGNTACGSCDVTSGATGAVVHATVWVQQAGGSWEPVTLPGLSALPERSSEATAIFDIPASSVADERLVAAGWAEDDAGVRQPVIWEGGGGGENWTCVLLPMLAGSTGGEVQAGDVGRTGHAFILDGTASQDDGTVAAYHWRQLQGPYGTPPRWEAEELQPLPGYTSSSVRGVGGREGFSTEESLAASCNVIGTSSGNGLPDKATLWEVYPLTVQRYEFDLTIGDNPALASVAISGMARGDPNGKYGGVRVAVGTATTNGPLAKGGAGTEGLPAETHAVAFVQVDPAPGVKAFGNILIFLSLAGLGGLVMAIRKRRAMA